MLDNAAALDRFLQSIERKAFRIAYIATGNTEEALDLVQDAMFKLVQKYADKQETDWPALFYTILNSRIYDWYRKTSVRNRWLAWLPGQKQADHDTNAQPADPVAQCEDINAPAPEQVIEQSATMQTIESALRTLPLRQQQAFLLRMWEEFSVEETATIMGCSQGSVKTHCFRAIAKLRELLEGQEL